MNVSVQIYTCLPQSHFLSGSGNTYLSCYLTFLLPCPPLPSPTFLLLLLTDPTRYLAASLNSPPASSHLSGLPFAPANINSFGSSCLQSNRFPEPKVRCVCFWMWQQHTADRGAAVRGEIHPPASLSLAATASLHILQFSNTPAILHKLCWYKHAGRLNKKDKLIWHYKRMRLCHLVKCNRQGKFCCKGI